MPRDADAPLLAAAGADAGDPDGEEEGPHRTWAHKFTSYLCCRKPRVDEDGGRPWRRPNTLVLDVMSLPNQSTLLK